CATETNFGENEIDLKAIFHPLKQGTQKGIMKAFGKKLSLALATPLLAGLLATQCFAVDHFVGVNFTGAGAGGAPTSLDPTDSAGVVPQLGWNNFGALSVARGTL